MKRVFFLAATLAFSLSAAKISAQDVSILPGEKVAITFFDFDFSGGYFGSKSVKVDEAGPNTLENRTLFQVLRQLEAKINERYGCTLEPAMYDTTDEAKYMTAKCYPKIKKKNALALGYDKIIEIRAYMRPSAAMSAGIGPVSFSAPKPVMYLNMIIYNKAGKQVFNIAGQVKDEERQKSVAIYGFQAGGGFTGASILELYGDVLAKVFTKSDKKNN